MYEIVKSIVRYYLIIIGALVIVPTALFLFLTGWIWMIVRIIYEILETILPGLLPLWVMHWMVKKEIFIENRSLLIGIKWWMISCVAVYLIALLCVVGNILGWLHLTSQVTFFISILMKPMVWPGVLSLWGVTLPIGIGAFYIRKSWYSSSTRSIPVR